MYIKTLKDRLKEYNNQKGYFRLYFWGDHESTTLLKYFLASKNDTDNVSYLEFHKYLQRLRKTYVMINFTGNNPSTCLRGTLLFLPWLDELTIIEKQKVEHQTRLSYEAIYGDRSYNPSGGYWISTV